MYKKINFKDKIVEKPMTYDVQTNDDGTVTLIESAGEVYQEGTDMNANNMDHIEEGIVNVENKVKNKQNKVLSGTTEPSNDLGEDGDIYLQYEN